MLCLHGCQRGGFAAGWHTLHHVDVLMRMLAALQLLHVQTLQRPQHGRVQGAYKVSRRQGGHASRYARHAAPGACTAR
jgi:hypothetical protein